MNERRHDLDALRAGAMLLGIVLHAALAYTGIPIWPTVDDAWPPFMAINNIIHGFRMPLFFLLSGFFTAMLWKRRGLGGLLIHRVKRILLPLVVGMFTIIPLTWAAIIISDGGGEKEGPKASDSLWAAAAFGDLDEIDRFLDEKPDINAQDPFLRQTALGWACNAGHPQAVAKLLAAGADPNQRYGNEGKDTALHSAVFFGRGECTALLIEAGADQTARNPAGERPVDLLKHNLDVVQYFAGILKVPVDPEAWEKGRKRAKQLLDTNEPPAATEAPKAVTKESEINLEPLIAGLFLLPVFHHLWFLWHLCWLVLGFALVRLVLKMLPKLPNLPAWLVASPVALVWMVPLILPFQLKMHGGSMAGWGPDTSIGLLPFPHLLVYEFIFFMTGALIYFTPKASERFGNLWWLTGGLAFAAYLMEPTTHMQSAVQQTVYVWTCIFAAVGLCRSVLAEERSWVRQISEASYWLYLTHLPVVMVLQHFFAQTNLDPILKFSLITLITTVGLYLPWQYIFKRTIVGRLLIGRASSEPSPNGNPA